jgi:hypothetical protein
MASTKNWDFILKKNMGQMPTNAEQQDVTKVISVWPPCALLCRSKGYRKSKKS